jgi:hypothetical protein
VNRGVVRYLVTTLGRAQASVELQRVALAFLKKLSILGENVDSMGGEGVVATLAALAASTPPPDITTPILRLLFNLSFSGPIRDAIIQDSALLFFAANVCFLFFIFIFIFLFRCCAMMMKRRNCRR